MSMGFVRFWTIKPLNVTKVNEAIERALLKEDDSEEDVENILMAVEDNKTFAEVKEELTNYVMAVFYENDKMDDVKRIVESVLGVGQTVNDATEMQKDSLEIILVKLMDRAEELGINK